MAARAYSNPHQTTLGHARIQCQNDGTLPHSHERKCTTRTNTHTGLPRHTLRVDSLQSALQPPLACSTGRVWRNPQRSPNSHFLLPLGNNRNTPIILLLIRHLHRHRHLHDLLRDLDLHPSSSPLHAPPAINHRLYPCFHSPVSHARRLYGHGAIYEFADAGDAGGEE